ncbi:MAG: YlxR family protein [Cyanobacteria bacterium J06639_1]
MRRCIACRSLRPRQELLRVVRDAASAVVRIDEGMGRSAYICPCPSCLQVACQKRRLHKALRTPIPEAIHEQLQRRSCQADSLAGPFEASSPC